MVETEVDVHEEHWFAFKLEDNKYNTEVVALPDGDFRITDAEGHTTVIERKTWGDAMGSWKSRDCKTKYPVSCLMLPHHSFLLKDDPN